MYTTPSKTTTISQNGEGSTDMLTTHEAALYFGLAASTLNKWRVYGRGPRFIKLGRAIRYRRCDLDAYLASHTLLSTTKS